MRSKIFEMMLGVKKVYAGVAKLVVVNRGNTKCAKKILVGGVVVLPEGAPEFDSNDWQMIECDIVIVPKRRYATKDPQKGKGTIEQILCAGYEQPDFWDNNVVEEY